MCCMPLTSFVSPQSKCSCCMLLLPCAWCGLCVCVRSVSCCVMSLRLLLQGVPMVLSDVIRCFTL